MKIPEWLPVFGDTSFRGKCPSETAEQVTFFARVRREWPDTYGRLIIHPRNEGKRNYMQTAKQKAEGMTPGASDIVLPGSPAFVCEMKRQDHTACRWEHGQVEYLKAAKDAGAFVCVALGCEGATDAFHEWLALRG